MQINFSAACYGTTYSSIFRLTTTGSGGQMSAFDGTNGNDLVAGLTLASDGNFYGTATFGGTLGKGTFFRVTPSGNITVLHEFSGDADGAFPEAAPIEASDGNLYGTTRGASEPSTIYQYARSGKFSTIYKFDDAHGIAAFVPLVQASDGNLYGTAQAGGALIAGPSSRSLDPEHLFSSTASSAVPAARSPQRRS